MHTQIYYFAPHYLVDLTRMGDKVIAVSSYAIGDVIRMACGMEVEPEAKEWHLVLCDNDIYLSMTLVTRPWPICS
jgi:hypothetical protein